MNLAHHITLFLCKKNILPEDKCALYEYSLNILLSTILHIGLSMCIGIAFNMIKESLLLFISFFLIRKVAGGFHASTFLSCLFFSVFINIVALNLILIAKEKEISLLFISVLPTIIIYFFAPIASPNKPMNDAEIKYFKLISKIISTIICVSSFATYKFLSPIIGISIGIGLAIEAFSLVMAKIYFKIKHLFKNGDVL